jgi:glycosyltransferase involved in cell wall biosynthesis
MVDRRWEISIVLPAFNEEANIFSAIDHATAVARRLCSAYEIVVVDDGSTDSTAAMVEERAKVDDAIRLIRHVRNRGYGEALRTGFAAAALDLVVFTDADNQFDLSELERFLPWIDHVDVVAGYRLNRQDPLGRRLISLAWNSLVRVLFYVPVRDIDCALKLFRRSVLKELDLQAVGAMVNTELMVKLGRSGFSVVEVGVTHFPRTAGTARGANPRVVGLAFVELFEMYRRLRSADAEAAVWRLPPSPVGEDFDG